MKFLVLLTLILSSCIPTNTGKRYFISNPQKERFNKDIHVKTNGAYFGFHKNAYTSDYGISYFFFYNNGVMRNMVFLAGTKDTVMEAKEIIEFIERDSKYRDSAYGHKKDGGAFRVDSNYLMMQDFVYMPGAFSWDLRTFTAHIINDTLIYIDGCKLKGRPDYCIDSYYLKFISMNKPDSTNRLMKKKWYWKTD